MENLKKELLCLLCKKNFHKDSIDRIKLAISVGAYYHRNQTRDSGELYFTHPISVSILLLNYFEDTTEEEIIIGLLHDSLEDTEISKIVIDKLFGSFILKSIKDLSKRDKIEFLNEEEKKIFSNAVKKNNYPVFNRLLKKMKKKRDNLYYGGIPFWSKSSIRVKLCDRLHNLSTLSSSNEDKIRKNIESTARYFLNIDLIKNTKIYFKMKELLGELSNDLIKKQDIS